LCVAHEWSASKSIGLRTAAWTGVILGLALLTKIQAVLLPLPIAIWALWHWRQRAVLPLLVFGVVGAAVFFAGWPWLWLDPLGHVQEYLGRATERVTLYTFYFGERYADADVPWHYPWVMFLITVPLGLHALGLCGVFASSQSPQASRRGISEPREQLLLAAILFPLIVFSLPGVAVYDGARLFLVVFPLWAVLIGRGSLAAWEWIRRQTTGRLATAAITVFLLLQSAGVVRFAPVWLSYYNVAVGGLYGADRLGLEINYWGDAVTRSLLEETARHVPEGSTVHVSPVVHPLQLNFLEEQSPILRERGIELEPYDPDGGRLPEYVLVFRREADLPPLPFSFNGQQSHSFVSYSPRVTVERQGVVLGGLYER
ncbi:MAG: hypothetical protein ACREIV_02730, partial [Planctomycetaceae bacterium]